MMPRTARAHTKLTSCRLLWAALLVGVGTASWLLTLPEPPRSAWADGDKTPGERPLDFNRDVKPILSDHCYACHGPDQKHRQAGLRLDTHAGATAKLESGQTAVVPGKLADSELIARIVSTDPERQMPPPDSSKKLTAAQVELLKKWVAQGATWAEHWAYVPPVKSAVPTVAAGPLPIRTPVDAFVLARLAAAKLSANSEADGPTLLRRVSLDLTGLPPTPEELDAYTAELADPARAATAYDRAVSRLLESPRFGEHMARYWLDAARFGDTHGMHLDNYREMWPYRDWVVRAFNANKPFNEFLLEQLAGDLLEKPTTDQLVATGFVRCHVTTNEGGSIYDEVYCRNVFDRVETFGTVVLGQTFTCARCHDHKYDPVRQKDYYGLFAFFNSLDGSEMDGNVARYPPVLTLPTPEQTAQLARLNGETAAVRKQIAAARAEIRYDDPSAAADPSAPKPTDVVWIEDDLPTGAKPGGDGRWIWGTDVKHKVHSGKRSHRGAYTGQGQHFFENAKSGLKVAAGDVLFAYVWIDPADVPRELMLQWNTGAWSHRAYWGENLIAFGKDNSGERRRLGDLPKPGEWARLEVPVDKVGLTPGQVITGMAFTQHGGQVYWDRAGIVTTASQKSGPYFDTFHAWLTAKRADGKDLPKPIADIVKLDAVKRKPEQTAVLLEHFVENAWSASRDVFEPLMKKATELDKQKETLDKEIPATLIFREAGKPKPSHILKRGEYDQKGEVVARATPTVLPAMPADLPQNRLGLARWALSPEHPLTARVAVNRFWQQVFGTGLVKTAEDFGAQGEPPSHPELLDYLAVDFRESGWDVKRLMRLLVSSSVYRQSAKVTAEKLAADPANRLLSRGPRYRLDAEMLRDQALFAAGLLVEQLGGPSVKPPQPSGLWEAVGFSGSNTARFSADTGREKVHRRSLYTFVKRTALTPTMSTFDAPSREACCVRRERTNTPLQALLLLNEVQFVEAARALAERGMKTGGATPPERATRMFRLAVCRSPEPAELKELVSLYAELAAGFAKDEKAARELIAAGETKPSADLPPAELAAWTLVASALLNLDEVLNK